MSRRGRGGRSDEGLIVRDRIQEVVLELGQQGCHALGGRGVGTGASGIVLVLKSKFSLCGHTKVAAVLRGRC